MARPVKQSLSFFPVLTSFMHDAQTRRLMQREGKESIAMFLYVLSDIYSNSYYQVVNPDYVFDLADQFHWKEEDVQRKIDTMVELGFFDAAIYEQYNVLTSADIQARYEYVKRKQSSKASVTLYRIVEAGEGSAGSAVSPQVTPIAAPTTPETCEETPMTTPGSTQTKQNETTSSPFTTDARAIEQFREKLQADDRWKKSLVTMGGGDEQLVERLPEAMRLFENHLTSIGETNAIATLSDYARRFTCWWRCWGYKPASAIVAHQASPHKKKPTAAATPTGSKMVEAMEASKRAADMALKMICK